MNKQESLQKMRIIMIAAYLVFVLAMTAWAVVRYNTARHALADLETQKTRLARLNTEVTSTQSSVERLKNDQDEFKKLLFNDRDVPAFIDGISNFAITSSVHITDMETQRFSRIVVPKDLSGANKTEMQRASGIYDDEPKIDPQAQFKDMLTLAAMPIHIKIQGTFAAIVNFLNSVENERQLLTVSNVEITRNTMDYPQLDCEFNLKIYSLENLKDIKT